MEKRKLGRSGPSVSAIGFGCMAPVGVAAGARYDDNGMRMVNV